MNSLDPVNHGKSFGSVIGVGLLAGVCMLAACDANQPGPALDATPTSPAAAVVSSAAPAAVQAESAVGLPPHAGSDEAISAQVKGKLASDVELRRSDIAVQTSEGKVRLSGQVSDTSQIVLAEAKAATVEGVRGVENRLSAK